MLQTRAIFQRKSPTIEVQECQIEKVITLSDSEYARFHQMLLDDYDFIRDNRELMCVEDGVTHCILVVGETTEDGILVNSEGGDYARCTAFFPHAKSFLLTHGQVQNIQQEEHVNTASESPSAVAPISPALLAYGEKLQQIVNGSIKQALDGHDQSTYIISLQELHDIYDNDVFDDTLFIAMLKERPEIVDMDVSDGDIMVTLSLESILAHDRSQLRVITQDDLKIMHAKHTLWTYDQGGEEANFSDCLLSGLDMSHMQFNGVNFSGALLENVNMCSSGVCFGVFQGARFVGCKMTGICAEEADFNGATFEDCNIKQGHLAHSNFAHVQFLDTDLWMADMHSCCIEGTNIADTDTTGVNLNDTSEDEESWVNDFSFGMGDM